MLFQAGIYEVEVGNLTLIPLCWVASFPILPIKIQKNKAFLSFFPVSFWHFTNVSFLSTYVHVETIAEFWSTHSNEWDILKVVKCNINIESSHLGKWSFLEIGKVLEDLQFLLSLFRRGELSVINISEDDVELYIWKNSRGHMAT